jgi:putative peptidoglycan lipid II flippase
MSETSAGDSSAKRSPSEGREILKASSSLSVMTLTSRVLGLIREMTRATLMGTGPLAEAFTVGFNMPNFFRKIFAEGSVNAAFIPTIKGYIQDEDEVPMRDFISATFTVLIFAVSLVTLLGIVLADFIVIPFGCALPGEAATLTRIMFPFLVLVSVAALFQGMLNSKKIFTPSGLAPILFNLCFIFLPQLFNIWLRNPARSMAWSVVVGGFFQAICQLPAVLRADYRFGLVSLKKAFANPGTKKVLGLIAPTILGVAAYELNSMVSVALASNSNSATAINLSLRLQELILGIFVVSISTVILPLLSGKAKEGDWKGFNDRITKSLDTVSLITLPIAAFCLLECKDIVGLLFMRGRFDQDSVRITAGAFFYHSMGLFFIGQNRILAPAFYAREDTKLPTLAGLINVGVNVIMAFILSFSMRGLGIALALSVASAVNTALLVVFYLRKENVDRAAFARSGLYALRLVAFSVVAGAAVWFLSPWAHAQFSQARNGIIRYGAPLVILTAVYGAIGVFLLVVSRDPNLRSLTGRFSRRK